MQLAFFVPVILRLNRFGELAEEGRTLEKYKRVVARRRLSE